MLRNLGIKTKLNLILTIFALVVVVFVLVFTIWGAQNVIKKYNQQASTLLNSSQQIINQTSDLAIKNSVDSLNEKSKKYLGRLALQTANQISDFLKERDKDLLFLSTLNINKKTLLSFYQSKKKRIVQNRKYEYDKERDKWILSNLDAAQSIKSTAENTDNEKEFIHHSPANTAFTNIPIYKEISFYNLKGREVHKVSSINSKLKNISVKGNTFLKAEDYFNKSKLLGKGEIYVSQVIGGYVSSKIIGKKTIQILKEENSDFEPSKMAYAGIENPFGKRFSAIIRFITPVFKNNIKIGYIALALDHRHIMDFTDHLNPTGDHPFTEISDPTKGNYAFIVNNHGETISHPRDAHIIGYNPKTGEKVPGWVSRDTYKKWRNSADQSLNTYLRKNIRPYTAQALSQKPSIEQAKRGEIGVDCKYAGFAPQCQGFEQISRNGGHGSFQIFFAGKWMLSSVATIDYKTGEYGNTSRGFGHVIINANVDEFHAPALLTKNQVTNILNEESVKLKSHIEESNQQILKGKYRFIRALILWAIIFLFVAIIFSCIITAKLSDRIENLLDGMKRFENNDLDSKINDPSADEIGKLAGGINQMAKGLRESTEHQAKVELSSQILHDMGSPIAALEMQTQDISELSEKKRNILRNIAKRMRDITQGFERVDRKSPVIEDYEVKTHLAAALMVPLISEKRIEYKRKSNIDIDLNLGPQHYGLFVNVDAHWFHRILSNIINNSVNAYGKNSGPISVRAYLNAKNEVSIQVSDKAGGIPLSILPKVKENGFTYQVGQNDLKGKGRGLFDADQKISEWGGQLDINSQEGLGTDINITLPQGNIPNWFIPSLTLPKSKNIVILDDDPTIHQIWQQKFKKTDVQIINFLKASSLKDFCKKHNTSKNKCLFLIDYELIGEKHNGLSIIEDLDIEDNSILVTSRSEDLEIQKRCEQLGVGLIPKGLAAYVPIQNLVVDQEISPPYVLIEDEQIIRESWKQLAIQYYIDLDVFSSPKEFKEKIHNYPHNTNIYIDSKFPNGELGELFAKGLYDLGYRNIYLETSMNPNNFKDCFWIKEVVGKKAPFKNKNNNQLDLEGSIN